MRTCAIIKGPLGHKYEEKDDHTDKDNGNAAKGEDDKGVLPPKTPKERTKHSQEATQTFESPRSEAELPSIYMDTRTRDTGEVEQE